jgi:glutamine cyclotransferase
VIRTALLLACLGLSACHEDPVEWTTLEVLLTLPHDSTAYTQGLVYHDRFLWESTGRYGESTLRKVDPETGRVLLRRELSDSLFGEGLALVGSELVQLTWKEGVALVYDLDSLQVRRTIPYEGEGWGLCFDGRDLYMSNGSDSLYRRDPATFAVRGVQRVTSQGQPVPRLNELECVGEHVWANVYQEDRIVQIAKSTGQVVRAVDGYQLRLASGVPADGESVLNGIAYDPRTDVFFMTGKRWPETYVVRVAEGER